MYADESIELRNGNINPDDEQDITKESYRNTLLAVCVIIATVLWGVGIITFIVLANQHVSKDTTNPFTIMLHIFFWPGVIMAVFICTYNKCGVTTYADYSNQ
jgi:hypothetical protein